MGKLKCHARNGSLTSWGNDKEGKELVRILNFTKGRKNNSLRNFNQLFLKPNEFIWNKWSIPPIHCPSLHRLWYLRLWWRSAPVKNFRGWRNTIGCKMGLSVAGVYTTAKTSPMENFKYGWKKLTWWPTWQIFLARGVLQRSCFLGNLKPHTRNLVFGELQLEAFSFNRFSILSAIPTVASNWSWSLRRA